MMTFDEAECLKTNPFEGDFGSPGDKVLRDKIGTARKGGTCGMCKQEIVPGERVRLLAAVFDGELMSYRWCSECCAAMAACCTKRLQAQGVSYPRTCAECGLGPCKAAAKGAV